MESLAQIRSEITRERLLDMERRLKPYRIATFLILAAALISLGPKLGWWWLAPLTAGLAGFAVADHFLHRSERPQVWVAAAWAMTPLLVAGSVAATGGPASPLVMWFAIPGVTLGARFALRGIVFGTIYMMALLLASTVAIDPSGAAADYEFLVIAAGLLLSTVTLVGAMNESDRAHRKRSTLDPLTGVYNRNALEQRLLDLDGQPTSRAEGVAISFLLCDLDHFKRINDQRGHAAGDAVLQDVAYALRATLRASDSIYRVGGEEFLVVLPDADASSATEIAERLCEVVRERRPGGIEVTISIGVATSDDGVLDTDGLVQQADVALYTAKEGGRNRVVRGARANGAEVPA